MENIFKDIAKIGHKMDLLVEVLNEDLVTSNDFFLVLVNNVPELQENLYQVAMLKRKFPHIELFVFLGQNLTDKKDLIEWTINFFDYLISGPY